MRVLLLFSLFISLPGQAQDSLQRTDIPAAARISGLSFTGPEMDSLYPDLKEMQLEYLKLHALPLVNSQPPSIWHNLAANGFRPDTRQQPIRWNIPAQINLPANKNDLAFYSLAQLAALIKTRKISSVELTRFFIDRLRRFSDTLRCTTSITETIALREAAEADALLKKGIWLGPLHGIPYGLKDLFSVKNTRTTWGAKPFQEQVIDEDAFVYLQLKKAGAVLVAKFTLGALAMGDQWYGGMTRNPWNLNQGSSGSSAGSASATVAGLVPFAIGTETWGSIISPATRCGATGLRPSFGAVSRTGAMALCWSLDKIGPICRSAEDAAMVFHTIKGNDGQDGSAVEMAFNYRPNADMQKMRIAYAKNYFDKIDTTDSEWAVLDAFRRMGVNLIPMNFPDSAIYPAGFMDIILGAEAASAFDGFTRSNLDDLMNNQRRNDWPNLFRGWQFVPAVAYINANRHRRILMQQLNAAMAPYDAVIVPTFRSGNQLAITNLSGHPAICFPIGFSRNGSPRSITILGNYFQDAKICAVAAAYQQNTSWNDRHPEMFR